MSRQLSLGGRIPPKPLSTMTWSIFFLGLVQMLIILACVGYVLTLVAAESDVKAESPNYDVSHHWAPAPSLPFAEKGDGGGGGPKQLQKEEDALCADANSPITLIKKAFAVFMAGAFLNCKALNRIPHF